jgi:predicted DsbA family dithiol-disulfide isomerase
MPTISILQLDSGRYAEAHQQALHRARQLQITVVPTFPDRWSAAGGHALC